MKEKTKVRSVEVIKGSGKIEDLIKAVAEGTLEAIKHSFTADGLKETVYEDMKENGIEEAEIPEKVHKATLDLMKLHLEFCDRIDSISKENGLSFDITELLFHAPFVQEFLEEAIEIGKVKTIKDGNERKVN